MGFVRKRTTYRLKFTEPDIEGLEVVMGGLTMDQLMDMAELEELKGLATLTAEDRAKMNHLIEMFHGALIEWNMEEEDGTPVPTTLEVIKEDMTLTMRILFAWLSAMTDVAPPLETPSSTGKPPEGMTLPMEPLHRVS